MTVGYILRKPKEGKNALHFVRWIFSFLLWASPKDFTLGGKSPKCMLARINVFNEVKINLFVVFLKANPLAYCGRDDKNKKL